VDEALERLVQFRNALELFHQKLAASHRQVEQRRDTVSPHWQDANRRWHDERWGPLEESLRQFLTSEAPSCLEFLDAKIHALQRYLHG
jgi:hypothetical protein